MNADAQFLFVPIARFSGSERPPVRAHWFTRVPTLDDAGPGLPQVNAGTQGVVCRYSTVCPETAARQVRARQSALNRSAVHD